MKKWFIFIIGAVLLMSGCASIVSGGGYQTLTFDSTPTNATILINGKFIGNTPLTVKVKREKYAVLILKKDGYKERKEILNVGTNPWFFGNIIFGGLLGSSTDSSTGAIHEYSPGNFMLTLSPEKS